MRFCEPPRPPARLASAPCSSMRFDGDAKRFYLHFDFEVAPVDPMHLMLLMKDLRALLKK
jgi:hypothetical protein